jgi:hypothetical protein
MIKNEEFWVIFGFDFVLAALGFELGSQTCYTGTLPLESFCQPLFVY